MIIYNGYSKKNNTCYISFLNSSGISIDIPVDEKILNHIMMYLKKIEPSHNKEVERLNDEEGL